MLFICVPLPSDDISLCLSPNIEVMGVTDGWWYWVHLDSSQSSAPTLQNRPIEFWHPPCPFLKQKIISRVSLFSKYMISAQKNMSLGKFSKSFWKEPSFLKECEPTSGEEERKPGGSSGRQFMAWSFWACSPAPAWAHSRDHLLSQRTTANCLLSPIPP